MHTTDPYLLLRPQLLVADLPSSVLAHADTVRRASSWIAIGFSVELDAYGFPSTGSERPYKFRLVHEGDALISEAIRKNKRAVRDPVRVFDYVMAGCELTEFVDLADDVVAYCQGNLMRIQGKSASALPLLERAVQLNANEVRYAAAYYPLRLSLGDISSIEDEFKCFERDIDSIVHAGRFDEWMKTLIAQGEYQHARNIILRVRDALSRLVETTATPRFYGLQRPDWYLFKQEQFRKKADKYLSRMDKLEAKAARASTTIA